MNDIEIISEFVNWSILAFIFLRAIGTECFGKTEWILTGIAILFSYFIKYVNKKVKEDE